MFFDVSSWVLSEMEMELGRKGWPDIKKAGSQQEDTAGLAESQALPCGNADVH